MKNALSWVLLLGLTILLLNNCFSHTIKKDTTQKVSFVETLRTLYASGDTKKWPAPLVDAEAKSYFSEIGHLPEIQFPEDNPYSAAKALLGKTLFYDPRLSASNQIACASCHDPELGWTDNRALSYGHDRQLGIRNAMTILNSGYATSLFWDGRAGSLEEQSHMPMQDAREMNQHIDISTAKIAKIKGYESLFEKAFGDKTVTKDKITRAIATFERTVTSLPSKFDQFIDGRGDLYTDDEVMGLHIFRTKANCISCHNSGYFSSNRFENIGNSLLGSKEEDLGRYLVTKNPEDAGKFRVPSLREVTRTGPWMHNGSLTTLTEVIQFYNKGNPEPYQNRTTIDEGMILTSHPSQIVRLLELTDKEITQLEAFLGTLSTKPQRIPPPPLPQ